MHKTGYYGVLNTVLHPHPAGAYRNIFEIAGADPRGVRFHGDRFATMSPVSETRNGVFTGRLATWTEINPQSNLIEKKSLKESLLSESNVLLPDGVGFNSRVFSFAFREAEHQLYVELRNDENQTISIGRARLAFLRVFQAFKPEQVDELDVHIKTQSNAVEQVLSIPKIRNIEILLNLPNPDHLSEQKKAILEEIDALHAKRMKTQITKAAGEETLKLNPRYKAMAELAKDNGYLHAKGRDVNGDPIDRSTKKYPSEIEIELGKDDSRAIATRRLAEKGLNDPQ